MKISQITKKLIVYLLLFSILFTAIYTFIELKSEYNKKFNKLNEGFSQVEKTMINQLTLSLWNLDEKLLSIQLENILKLASVAYVEIKDPDNEIIEKKGKRRVKYFKDKSFSLEYKSFDTKRRLGVFYMQISYEELEEEFFKSLIFIVFKESIRFFLLSILLLYIIHKLFIRHLLTIENYTNKLSLKTLDAPLNLKKDDLDELDDLSNSINKMRENILSEIKMKEQVQDELKQLNEQLDRRVKEELRKNREKDLQLIEQSKMASMGEMISNISHQWRQPLSIISSCATGLKFQKEFGFLEDKDFFEGMDYINNNTQYLSETLDTFRNFLRGSKRIEEIKIKDIINNVMNIVGKPLEIKNINFYNGIEKFEDLKITLIPGELTQVLINILNNAKDVLLERNIKDPWIKLELEREGNKVILTIEDNGKGIPEDILPHIFEPYFTTKHKSQGTGLGLHISYRIITDSLKGKIYAKNTESGGKFFIELPLYN